MPIDPTTRFPDRPMSGTDKALIATAIAFVAALIAIGVLACTGTI